MQCRIKERKEIELKRILLVDILCYCQAHGPGLDQPGPGPC